MKVRDTSRGRMYAVSSEIGCTAINGAMAVDIPAGGQSVILALDKKIVIDGDDAAKFVEVRWGTNTAVGSRPVPSWLSDVLAGLVSIVGEANFDINYIPAENKLRLQFALEVTNEQIAEVKALLSSVLPQDLVTEMEWVDGLPIDYAHVAYLEGIGEQFLDIPRMWKQADSFRVEFISTLNRPNENVFGTTDTYRLINVPAHIRVTRTAGKYYDFTKAVKGEKNIVTINDKKITVNGRERPVEDATWDNPYESYKIFANNTMQYKGQFRLLRFEHLSDTNMILIPALDPTGRPCMYDTVGGKPYHNAGDGEFVVGMTVEQVRRLSLPVVDDKKLVLVLPKEAFTDTLAQEALERARQNGWELTVEDEESEVPVLYKRLDYLEGTGTQFMDTEGDVTTATGVRIEYEQLSDKDRLEEAVGTRGKNSAGKDVYWFVPREYLNDTEQQGYYYSIYYTYLPTWKRVTAEMNFQVSGKIKVQNSLEEREYNLPPVQDQDVTLPSLKLFGSAGRLVGRIWYCDISQGGNIVHSYIPALDRTGTPCMYDTVSSKSIYISKEATGDFLYPGKEDEATTYSLRNRMYAQMTEYGLRRLYHVPECCELTKEEYAEKYGFKLLVETPMPEEGYWTPVWHDREDCIELEWIEAEPPAEELQIEEIENA